MKAAFFFFITVQSNPSCFKWSNLLISKRFNLLADHLYLTVILLEDFGLVNRPASEVS